MRRPAPGTLACIVCVWHVATALLAPRLQAHEIPSDVTVVVIVAPADGRLSLAVRTPLEAMRDVTFPTRGQGYLDVERAGAALADAASLWLAGALEVYAGGERLPRPALVAARASLPSDRSFASHASARAHVRGPPLPAGTDIVWRQALLDALFEVPLPGDGGALAIRPAFERLGLRVRTVVRFEAPDGRVRLYQADGDPGLVELDPRWTSAALRFVEQGFRHILSGADHLLFLVCLVLPFHRQLRSLVLLVTAFTVGHSITLIGSALGLAPGALWFGPLVETLIAASIFYMAVENVIAPNLRARWVVASIFGLVHGFGFSSALRDTLQFAGDHVVLSLLAFNVGIELGQLLVLAVLVPVLSVALRKVAVERVAVVVLSVIVAHTAWHWMAERFDVLRAYPPFSAVVGSIES